MKGLVVCADCGKTMLVRRCKSQAKATKGQVYAIYCCKTYATYRNNICSMHYYREDDLNELVLKEIRTILTKYSNDEVLGNEYESTLANNNILDKYKNELDINENKHRELDKAISELYKDKVAELISTEDFTSIKKDLEMEKTKVSKVIDDLKLMLGNAKTNLTDEKSKKKMISNFLKMKNPNKQILKELIYKITIDESKNVKIYFKVNINGVL